MTFNEYLIAEYGQDWQGIHMDLVDAGCAEEERDDYHNKLIEDFEEHMESNGLEIVAE
jgi:hypothetical protein